MSTEEDARLVADAHEVATRIMAPWLDNAVDDLPDVTDQDRLALGFAVLFRRLLEPETRPLLSRCGWCVAAVGDDDAAWQSAEDFDLAGIKAHTLKCPHNPLVKRLEAADDLANAIESHLAGSSDRAFVRECLVAYRGVR